MFYITIERSTEKYVIFIVIFISAGVQQHLYIMQIVLRKFSYWIICGSIMTQRKRKNA